MNINTAQIPDALVSLPHWVVWRREERDGKPTKVPYAPTRRRRARSTDPATWGTFGQALDCYHRRLADGIGFVFAGDGLVGVDLDRCVDGHGVVLPWALEIVQGLASYTELSPGGHGLHVILRGALPEGGRRKGPVEMYDRARYFTVTGNRWPLLAPPMVEERQEQLALLHRSIFPPIPVALPPAQPAPAFACLRRQADDDALIARALSARNGDKFAALWRGDWSGRYRSQSEADLALCSILAFWTRDVGRIDRLFRQSGLFRDKWDVRHFADGRTYGQATIQRALRS